MLSLSFCFLFSTAEGVWRDDFSGDALKPAWTPMSELFVWEVVDGFLHVELVEPEGRRSPISGLELTAFPGPHQQFTIIATNIESTRTIGIALGRRFPPDLEFAHSYLFLTSHISGRVFNGCGGSGPLNWIPRHPGTVWNTDQLKEMKLTFNAGKFQMVADGELRADFFDEHFDQIEHISIVMWADEFNGEEGWVDSFTISGPSLGVEARRKLATTWGALKSKR